MERVICEKTNAYSENKNLKICQIRPWSFCFRSISVKKDSHLFPFLPVVICSCVTGICVTFLKVVFSLVPYKMYGAMLGLRLQTSCYAKTLWCTAERMKAASCVHPLLRITESSNWNANPRRRFPNLEDQILPSKTGKTEQVFLSNWLWWCWVSIERLTLRLSKILVHLGEQDASVVEINNLGLFLFMQKHIQWYI